MLNLTGYSFTGLAYICDVKIIYLHQHFRKPDQWGSTRSYYLAKAMVNAGHEVHIIAGGCRYESETIDGIRVQYLEVEYKQSFGFLKRAMVFFKFMIQSYWQAKHLIEITNDKNHPPRRTKKPQNLKSQNDSIVYASSTPLTVGISALLLKRYVKVPYIFEVRDLWPEAPIEMGIIKNGILKSLLFKITKRIYKKAEAIVSLSPGITEGIKKYKVSTPIHELSNFSDTELFHPAETNETLKEKYLKDGERGVVYFGAIGKANHLEYLLDIAEHCKNMPLRFFILGDGNRKARIMQLAGQKGLYNITFLPPVPKNEMPAFLSIMHFSYISFLDIPILGTCSPNKLFDSLATGLVCIGNSKGWMKELMEEERCGFYADPKNPLEFSERINSFLADENKITEYKNNARRIAEERYSERVLSGKLIEILDSF